MDTTARVAEFSEIARKRAEDKENKVLFEHWLEHNPAVLIRENTLEHFDMDLQTKSMTYDPYLKEWFLDDITPEDLRPDNKYYLEDTVKCICKDSASIARTETKYKIWLEKVKMFSSDPTYLRQNEYELLVMRNFYETGQYKRAIRFNSCNRVKSKYTCLDYPFSKNHTTKIIGNSCNDKLCPRCANAINLRNTDEALNKMWCTGSLFINYEFTIPDYLGLEFDHLKLKQRIKGEFFKMQDGTINRFCKVVQRTLKRFHDGDVGGVMVVHTFSSSTMGWLPHIHATITDKSIDYPDEEQKEKYGLRNSHCKYTEIAGAREGIPGGDLVDKKIKKKYMVFGKPHINKIKKWESKERLEELHDIYTEEFKKEFPKLFEVFLKNRWSTRAKSEKLVCYRHYTNTYKKLKHRLRYMYRLPAQFINEDSKGIYYDDHMKGEFHDLEHMQNSIHKHAQYLFADRIKEDDPIFINYVDKCMQFFKGGKGRVYLLENKNGIKYYHKDNEEFFNCLISHFQKSNFKPSHWFGWLSYATWQAWVDYFHMPYKPLENLLVCKCGAGMVFVSSELDNGDTVFLNTVMAELDTQCNDFTIPKSKYYENEEAYI